MQYIVVVSIHTTLDIVFPPVYRSSRAQRLAKQREKARFLRLFPQTGSQKIASWPRRLYSQISQIKNRQFICVICGFHPHGQEVVDKLFFNCQNILKAALMVRQKPTRPMNESKYPKSLSILLALNLCALLVTLIFSMEDIWEGVHVVMGIQVIVLALGLILIVLPKAKAKGKRRGMLGILSIAIIAPVIISFYGQVLAEARFMDKTEERIFTLLSFYSCRHPTSYAGQADTGGSGCSRSSGTVMNQHLEHFYRRTACFPVLQQKPPWMEHRSKYFEQGQSTW